jgi:hypothetical protein
MKTTIKFSLLFLALVLFFSFGYSQTKTERLDSLFNNINSNGELSGAFLIVDNCEFVYEKYFGFEDVEKKHPINENSRF